MRGLQRGNRVLHPKLGMGLVLRLVDEERARVLFDGSRMLPRTVEIRGLSRTPNLAEPRPQSAQPAQSAPPRLATANGPLRRCRVSATRGTATYRQALEALRLGVVPAAHVEDYTVGRAGEIRDLETLFKAGRGLRLVWGDYGAGKTHVLDLAEEVGLQAGFLTARVVLNPLEVPATHPKRLYRAFLHNLRYPGETEIGWRLLFAKLEASSEHAEPNGKAYSRFFSPVVFALRSGSPEVIDWLSDYIEGYQMNPLDVTRALRAVGWRGENVLSLSDYRTYGRMYVHMMGTLASWARDAGYRGLLLLMDEVECVDGLTLENYNLACEVLIHYAAATLPGSVLSFDVDKLYRGGHPVHRAIDLCFRPDQPLAVVMAFTPLDEIARLADGIMLDDAVNIRIQPLRPEDLKSLIHKVVALYRRGYPDFEPTRESVARLERQVLEGPVSGGDAPRDVVRTTVSWLDCLRYGREPHPGVLPGA